MRPAVFEAPPYRAVPLGEPDLPALQRFYEANPEYFVTVGGEPPAPDQARQEFDDLPPPGMPFGRRWMLGFVDRHDDLAGNAEVLSDFLAAGVWHIGLFIVATRLHGAGDGPALYRAMEAWMAGEGAAWVRLGVIVGNGRGERFWERQGYTEVRRRTGVPAGARLQTVRVMVKPLGGGRLDDYLARVARDRPDSTLP